jgi:hypothetical protein
MAASSTSSTSSTSPLSPEVIAVLKSFTNIFDSPKFRIDDFQSFHDRLFQAIGDDIYKKILKSHAPKHCEDYSDEKLFEYLFEYLTAVHKNICEILASGNAGLQDLVEILLNLQVVASFVNKYKISSARALRDFWDEFDNDV